jgi:hypothetical protein
MNVSISILTSPTVHSIIDYYNSASVINLLGFIIGVWVMGKSDAEKKHKEEGREIKWLYMLFISGCLGALFFHTISLLIPPQARFIISLFEIIFLVKQFVFNLYRNI